MWRLPATFLAVVTLLVDVTYQVRAAALIDDNNQVGLIRVSIKCPRPVRFDASVGQLLQPLLSFHFPLFSVALLWV